jgi:hypothetical protein
VHRKSNTAVDKQRICEAYSSLILRLFLGIKELVKGEVSQVGHYPVLGVFFQRRLWHTNLGTSGLSGG